MPKYSLTSRAGYLNQENMYCFRGSTLDHSVQGYTFIEENFPGLFTADTGLPQALDDIKSKKNQFQRSKNFT